MSKLQIINAGWLIDGSGNSIRTKVQLRVINGRIDAIRENWPAPPGKRPDSPDLETLDVSTSLSRAIELENDPVDHVKIVNSGLNSLREFGKQTLAQFDGDELSAAVSAADQRRLKIMVHANGQNPVQTAVAAGCHSIEHGFFMGGDNLSLMADKAVFWVPTAVTMRAYCRYLNQIGENPDIARKNLDHQLEQLRTARQLGVPIALGTDAG